jgi:hypothetical protein
MQPIAEMLRCKRGELQEAYIFDFQGQGNLQPSLVPATSQG